MNNKNMLKLKKVNEERYFKNYSELFYFVLKNRNQSEEQFYNSASLVSVNKEVIMPLLDKSQHRFVVIGNFICLINEGYFNRTSGTYKYNILTVQNRLNLCHNDMRQLFNY